MLFLMFAILCPVSSNKTKGREVKSASKPKQRTNIASEAERPKTFHPRDLDASVSVDSPAPSDPSDMTLESMSECSGNPKLHSSYPTLKIGISIVLSRIFSLYIGKPLSLFQISSSQALRSKPK